MTKISLDLPENEKGDVFIFRIESEVPVRRSATFADGHRYG